MAVNLFDIKSLDDRKKVIDKINDGHCVFLGNVIVQMTDKLGGYPPDKMYAIENLINSSDLKKWAVDVSITGVYVKESVDIFVGNGSRVYNVCVDLSDKNYMFWKLINE